MKTKPPPGPRSRTSRRKVVLAGQDPLTILSNCWAAILAANIPERIFLYGNRPVRVQHDCADVPQLEELSLDAFRHELACAIRFQISVGKKLKDVLPPSDLARIMLANPSLPLPYLDSVVRVPVLAADGRFVDTAGYDRASRILLDPMPGLTIPQVPTFPSNSDITAAKVLLDELHHDFPFVGPPDKANAIALLLQPFVLPHINGPTPAYGASSPTPGTGKGLMVKASLTPAFGPDTSPIPAPDRGDECAKKLFAMLLGGAQLIFLDNLNGAFNSGAAASMMTTRTFTDRILGVSKMGTVNVRCTFVLTGNNLAASAELARRIVPINLDANAQAPWKRSGFKHPNLLQWAMSHRGDLVWSALVLIRAWQAAGYPPPSVRPMGSFEEWTRVLGGILQNAGIPGFLGHSAGTGVVVDCRESAWDALIPEWLSRHGETPVGVKELLPLAEAIPEFPWPDTAHSPKSRSTRLGQGLTRIMNRVTGSHKVVAAGSRKGAGLYRLQPVNLSGPQAQSTPTSSSAKPVCQAAPSTAVDLGGPSRGPIDGQLVDLPHDGELRQQGPPGPPGSPQSETGGPSDPQWTSGEPGGET